MVGQYQGGHERVQDDGRHGTKWKCVAREDKGRPIATWRRPLGEKKVREDAMVHLSVCPSVPLSEGRVRVTRLASSTQKNARISFIKIL